MTRKEWLVIAILTFLTICAWVIFDTVHARSQVDISPEWKDAREPIDPQFNIGILENTK